jgi:hypothetical protein
LRISRKLDAIMAEQVLGCNVEYDAYVPNAYCRCSPTTHTDDTGTSGMTLRSYSEDGDASLDVVRGLLSKRYDFELSFQPNGKFVAQFIGAEDYSGKHRIHRGVSDTVPHAICLAALDVVGE